jgi:hypothetical protein
MKNNCHKYNEAFSLCVDALEFAAKRLDPIWPGGGGMNYTKINVLLFCVVGPIIFASSVGLNIVLALKVARLGR